MAAVGGQSQAVNFISQQLLFAHNLLFRYVVAGLNTVRIYFLKKRFFFLLLNFKLKNECIFSFFSAGSHHVFAGAVLCLHPISGRIRTIWSADLPFYSGITVTCLLLLTHMQSLQWRVTTKRDSHSDYYRGLGQKPSILWWDEWALGFSTKIAKASKQNDKNKPPEKCLRAPCYLVSKSK